MCFVLEMYTPTPLTFDVLYKGGIGNNLLSKDNLKISFLVFYQYFN